MKQESEVQDAAPEILHETVVCIPSCGTRVVVNDEISQEHEAASASALDEAPAPVEEETVAVVEEAVPAADTVEPVDSVVVDDEAPAPEVLEAEAPKDVAPTSEEELKVETSEQPERPKSPWTPSYSVETQGPGTETETEGKVDEPLADTPKEEPAIVISEETVAAAEQPAEVCDTSPAHCDVSHNCWHRSLWPKLPSLGLPLGPSARRAAALLMPLRQPKMLMLSTSRISLLLLL